MVPRVRVDLKKLESNAHTLREHLLRCGIEVASVTKVFGADPKIVEAIHRGGIRFFADSRWQNLQRIDPAMGKRLLLRIPMLSEVEMVAKYADMSLQSEWRVLQALDEAMAAQSKTHEVLLMIDLGDLREGFFDEEDLFATAEKLLRSKHLRWVGTGTNLTCYGGVLPTRENLDRLVRTTRKLEEHFRISLPWIAAGNSSSLYLTESGKKEEWNFLRIGEAIVVGTEAAFGQPYLGLHRDCFVLETEVVESKRKPSVPIGEIGKNAFGETPVFEDEGEQLRLIVAIGRQDVDPLDLEPLNPRMRILGASSDHMILDGTHLEESDAQVGSRVLFNMNYRAILRTFTSSYIDRVYL